MKLKNHWRFLAVFLFLLVSLLILEQTKTLARKDNWPVMLNASRRMEVAMAAVREEKLNRGYKISPIDDPNQTGMIGGFLQAPYLQSIRLRRCAAHLVYKIPTSI